MKTVTQYKTVKNWDNSAVDNEVNALLAQGWQPLGGPVISVNGSTNVIIQAMVFYIQNDTQG